jgi:hypothetical protein
LEDLVVRWSFTALVAEIFEVVFHLCESRSLSVDVLSMSFSALHCSLPYQNGLFLPEPLDLLLDSGQLLFFCCRCFFLSFVIPIINLDVIRLADAGLAQRLDLR